MTSTSNKAGEALQPAMVKGLGQSLVKSTLLAIVSFLVAEPALAGTRQNATVLMSDIKSLRDIQEDLGFNDAIVVDDTIYLSGIVAGLRQGETDLVPAYERVYEYIGKVLTKAGAGWDDVVDITSFHTDLTTQMPAMVAVQKRYIKAPFPAWTAIGVARLIPDRGLTEIKIVARKSKP